MYTKVNYEDVDPVGEAMHLLREPLDTEQVGVTVARCPPGWKSVPHEHSDNDHEEVYVLIDGEADVVVDDERIPMAAGDAIHISSESTRQIQNGDVESAFVLVSGPEELDSEGTDSEWILTGFSG